MSRIPLRLAVLASAALFPVALRAADDLPPPTPADLVRGLRQAGLSDLALEYLDQAGKTAAPDAQLLLTLERARLRVDLASQETDEVKRDELTSAAKIEFDDFLKKAPNHPRGPEAAVAVAQIYSLQGAAQFGRAVRGPEANRKAEALKARELYQQASARFATAADRLATKAVAATGDAKKEATRELLQAKLDAAINQYRLGLAFLGQTQERGAAIQAALRGQSADKGGRPALTGFDLLSREDATQPACWVARAWIGECHLKLDEPKEAEKVFKDITTEYRRLSTPAARAGYRMARFFELRFKFDTAGTAAENKAVADASATWLTDFRSARPTPETFSVLYFRGRALHDQAAAVQAKGMEDAEKAKKAYVVTPELVQLYRTAEAELKKLVATENEYTDRATNLRNRALRAIVGDAVRPPAQYATFDECHMAGLVQYLKMTEAKTPGERGAMLPTTTALLERARQLPVPAESAREAQTSTLMLVSTYRMAGRPAEAAVLAEFSMRSSRTATGKARFGRQALGSYLDAAAKVPANDPVGRRVDTDRAVAVALFLDKEVPADLIAEEARIILADQLNRDGKPLEAFDAYTRVTPKAARYAFARLQEGGLAYTLIRPLPADSAEAKKRPALAPEQKRALYSRATADLAAVPRPPADAAAADALAYLRVQLQLAQLHVAAGGDACATAERLVLDARAAVPTFPDVKPDDRAFVLLQTELIRIDAVFEQARVLSKADKFKEAADRLAPLLADVASAGPAVKDGQPPAVAQLAARLDANRISYAVVPALNARVREGDIAKAGELLDVLKKLGGDARRGIAAVYQVVDVTRPQIDALRKANNADAANKLNASVAQLVGKMAAEKNLTADDNLNLGRAFVKLEDYPQALALLALVPTPAADDFKAWADGQPKKAEVETDEAFKKRSDGWQVTFGAVNRFRLAALDRVRALRLSGDLKGCEALIDEVMGKEELKPKAADVFVRNGPFGRRPEFRRELFHFFEAKALATPVATALPVWARAIREWTAFNNEYRTELVRPEPKEEQAAAAARQYKESIRPFFFDTFYEKSRCQVAAYTHVKAGAALAAGLAGVAANMKKMEAANAADFHQPTHTKLYELLEAHPDLKTAYTAEGGKMFLTKTAEDK